MGQHDDGDFSPYDEDDIVKSNSPVLEEEWTTLKRYGKEIAGYQISNHGKILQKNSPKLMKTRYHHNAAKPYEFFDVHIQGDLFDYEYRSANLAAKGGTARRMTIFMHRAVKESFHSIDEYPPISKEAWDQCPEEAKQWIRDTAYVDHMDDNCKNNRLDNLDWVTPKQNNSYHKDVANGGSRSSGTIKNLGWNTKKG